MTLKQEPGTAVISIADTGPGLPHDQLDAVFEPSVRIESSRSRDTEGVGLGLAIAERCDPLTISQRDAAWTFPWFSPATPIRAQCSGRRVCLYLLA